MRNIVNLRNRRKMNKGITLIALVITIIVLLILAGVSIATATQEKGIIKEARTAKELAEKASLEELVDLSIIKAEEKNRNPTLDDIIKELKNNKVVSKNEQIDRETGSIRTDAGYLIEGKLDDYLGNNSGGNDNTTGGGDTEEPPKPTLPNTDDTKPYLPDDNTTIISNNPDTGIIIKDSNNNEWVWIEVPKSIYATTTTQTDYTAIETAMQNYAKDYRQTEYTDTFYSSSQHGFKNSTEYNDWKNSMLSSVFENGGFYIGRYEVGTKTARYSSEGSLTTPLVRRDIYPYNFVTFTQAQTLSKQLSTGEKQASLMFGIQWDLVMKCIETKGAKTQKELKSESLSNYTWGNYYHRQFEVNREQGLYTTSPEVSGSWNTTKNYTKPKSAVLLTTGATDENSAFGIYDLAGNVWEYTLERANIRSWPNLVNSERGGSGFGEISGVYNSAFGHNYTSVDGDGKRSGFRAALW